MAAFWEAFGSILAVPGGSGTRSGFWAFPDSAGAAQKRFLGAPGAFLAGVLGVSWGRLGASWGCLGGQDPTEVRGSEFWKHLRAATTTRNAGDTPYDEV